MRGILISHSEMGSAQSLGCPWGHPACQRGVLPLQVGDKDTAAHLADGCKAFLLLLLK